MKTALIIFIRNPVPGKVKTRLAKTIGEENALKVYKKLLAHTHHCIKDLACDKFIFYADGITINDQWPNELYIKEQQADGNLGEKMADAFNKVFSRDYSKALIIGSDCYDLTPNIIEQAFLALDEKDIVLGPALDGGYYLLGQKKLHPSLFKIKEWSTSAVLQQTITACTNAGLSYEQLQMLSDVDEEKDISFTY